MFARTDHEIEGWLKFFIDLDANTHIELIAAFITTGIGQVFGVGNVKISGIV